MTYNSSYTRDSGPFRIVIRTCGVGFTFDAYIRCLGWQDQTPWLTGELRSDDRRNALNEAEGCVSEFFAAHSDAINRGLINLSNREGVQ